MAKSKSKPAAKNKPKPAPAKAAKPAAKSSSKPKPTVKPVKKSVPKPKAKPAKAPAKPVAKNVKPASAHKPAKPAHKPAKPAPAPASKKAPVKPTVSPASPAKSANVANKPAATKTAAPAEGKKNPASASAPASARDKLRSRILAQKTKPAKPVAFSLDEVREVAKSVAKVAASAAPASTPSLPKAAAKTLIPADSLRAAKPAQIKAASLADILGFNPKQKASHAESEEATIPDKFKRYYKLLIELRNHVTGQVDQHAEETLKRSAKEDSGDLSSYGTDGGTDSFDRDFALSLVANEQEALAEIEAAIQRIKAGTYGICEHTQQPINKERLIAVPFTRFTAAAMKEIEKTRYKVRGQTGILGEGEEGAKVEDDSGGDE
jgi:RNA polymerase-binding transcription factor DksA